MRPAVRVLWGAVAALAARTASADPIPERGYGLPRDASVDGFRVDWLIHFTLVAVAIIFVIVLAALLWAVFRHGRGHPARYTHGTRSSVALVAGGVALVAVAVDGNLFFHTMFDMSEFFWNFEKAEAQPDAVRIEVNAHQWSWTARYAGPDGKFNTPDDIVTTDDIRVPVDAAVIIQLVSNDVIHSMYLPNFRVKQDAVPGMTNRLTFRAKDTGEYEIACAQHCGPNHYKMRGILTVLPPDRYREWLDTAEAVAKRAYDPDDADAHWGWDWSKRP
jgi:cytochrome c oxidase subunit II